MARLVIKNLFLYAFGSKNKCLFWLILTAISIPTIRRWNTKRLLLMGSVTNEIRCPHTVDGQGPDEKVLDKIASSLGVIPPSSYSLWIIITKNHLVPTKAIRSAASRAHKNRTVLIVVNDQTTPSNWTYPNCTIIFPKDDFKFLQKNMPETKKSSMLHKVEAYLRAIKGGSEFIYSIADDILSYKSIDNTDERYMKNFHFQPLIDYRLFVQKQPTATDSVLFNPFVHFGGYKNLKPCGYPTEQTTDRLWFLNLTDPVKPASMQQSLIDYDYGSSITFDPIAPPVNLAFGVYAPFDGRNTLYRYEAFWALAPLSSSPLIEIFRGYWALRLLWDIGETAAFYPPNSYIIDKNRTNAKKVCQEDNKRISMLVNELHKWRCALNKSFQNCALDLASMMLKKGFWSSDDSEFISRWFISLSSVGYIFPKVKIPIGRNHPKLASNANNPENAQANYFSMHPVSIADRLSHSSIGLKDFCAPYHQSFVNHNLQTINHFKNVVLVIIFNRAYYKNIPTLKLLYDPYFANVIFCATFSREFLSEQMSSNHDDFRKGFSYINLALDDMGTPITVLFYLCALRAYSFGLMNVDGYYLVHDDMLLNVWNPFDTKKMHGTTNDCMHAGLPNLDIVHMFFVHPYRPSIQTIREAIESKSDPVFSKLPQELLDQLLELKSIEMFCKVDIHYMPSDAFFAFVQIMNRMWHHRIFAEFILLEVMSVLGWRDPYDHIVHRRECLDDLRGISVSGFNRNDPFDTYYRHTDHFHHPTKLDYLNDTPSAYRDVQKATTVKKIFCNTFMKHLFVGRDYASP